MPKQRTRPDISHLLTDDAIARMLAWSTAPPDPVYSFTERELIDYRGQVYRSIAQRLLKVKTKRDLLSITRALELGALL